MLMVRDFSTQIVPLKQSKGDRSYALTFPTDAL